MNCPYFGQCGGCLWPLSEPQKQLSDKFASFLRELTPVIPKDKILFPLASVKNLYYRNKMEFAFGQSAPEKITLGLRRRKNFNDVIDLADCFLFGPGLKTLLNLWRDFAQQNKFPPYNLKTHQGFLRYLVVRKSFFTNQWLNILITTTPGASEFPRINQILEQMFKKLKNDFPEVSGLVWLTNDELSDRAAGKIQKTFGDSFLIEKIRNKNFIIQPTTFFQTNPETLELLIATIINWLEEVSWRQYALDLYCGVGLISLFLGDLFGLVSAVELNPTAVLLAIENAKMNNQKNIGFFAEDVSEYLKKCRNKFDLIVVDPPRAGLGKKVSKYLIETNPPVLFYVSCNPKTLADDLKILLQKYQVQKIQPIDFFPYTPHLESISFLSRK